MTDKPNKRNLYAIVAMQHRSKAAGFDVPAFVRSLPPDEPVLLIREPDNKYDSRAIQVWARCVFVGYIPSTQNKILAKVIDDLQGTVIAMDERLPAGRKYVEAKLHWGSNEHPLVEVS